MTSEHREPEQLFEQLAGRFLADPRVSQGTGFGSNPGLRVGTKIFAMLGRDDELVVKLSRQRVDQLVASGIGTRFDPGRGRLMNEWVTVPPQQRSDWEQLATEALQFVSSAAVHPPRR